MERNRMLVLGFALVATVVLVPLPVAAQSKGSTPARKPDGKPNLTGIYSFSTITPLQRPDTLAGKATLSDEEAVAFEASENKRQNRDLFDPVKGQPSAGWPLTGSNRSRFCRLFSDASNATASSSLSVAFPASVSGR